MIDLFKPNNDKLVASFVNTVVREARLNEMEELSSADIKFLSNKYIFVEVDNEDNEINNRLRQEINDNYQDLELAIEKKDKNKAGELYKKVVDLLAQKVAIKYKELDQELKKENVDTKKKDLIEKQKQVLVEDFKNTSIELGTIVNMILDS